VHLSCSFLFPFFPGFPLCPLLLSPLFSFSFLLASPGPPLLTLSKVQRRGGHRFDTFLFTCCSLSLKSSQSLPFPLPKELHLAFLILTPPLSGAFSTCSEDRTHGPLFFSGLLLSPRTSATLAVLSTIVSSFSPICPLYSAMVTIISIRRDVFLRPLFCSGYRPHIPLPGEFFKNFFSNVFLFSLAASQWHPAAALFFPPLTLVFRFLREFIPSFGPPAKGKISSAPLFCAPFRRTASYDFPLPPLFPPLL